MADKQLEAPDAKSGPQLIEVAAGKFEVNAQLFTAFTDIEKKLTAGGLTPDQAREFAWISVQALVDAGAAKKASTPKEHIPDLAEMAGPALELAAETNKDYRSAIANWVEVANDLREALMDAGLDRSAQPTGTGGDTFAWTRDGFQYRVRVPEGHDLLDLTQSYLSASRSARAHVLAIVRQVAENNHVDMDKVAVKATVTEDGKVILSQRAAGSRRGSGVTRTPGSNTTYKYETTEGGTIYRISTAEGAVLAETDPAAPRSGDLIGALKVALPAMGKKFYPTQWSRKAGWPKE